MPGFQTWMTFAGDKPATNAIVVATAEEAKSAGEELMSRWLKPTGFEVRPTDQDPNYRFDFEENKLVRIQPADELHGI